MSNIPSEYKPPKDIASTYQWDPSKKSAADRTPEEQAFVDLEAEEEFKRLLRNPRHAQAMQHVAGKRRAPKPQVETDDDGEGI